MLGVAPPVDRVQHVERHGLRGRARALVDGVQVAYELVAAWDGISGCSRRVRALARTHLHFREQQVLRVVLEVHRQVRQPRQRLARRQQRALQRQKRLVVPAQRRRPRLHPGSCDFVPLTTATATTQVLGKGISNRPSVGDPFCCM